MRLHLAFTILIGVGLLLSLGPFDLAVGGLISAAACVGLARSLRRLSPGHRILWSAAASISIGCFAFQWVVPALVSLAQIPVALSVPIFLVQTLLFNLKVPFLLLGFLWIAPRTKMGRVWIFAALALTGDLVAYQLFPWFWGNMLAGSDLLRQSARAWGIYGLSLLVFLVSGPVHDGVHLFVRALQIHGSGAMRGFFRALMRRLTGGRSLMWPALVVIFCVMYGAWRITQEPAARVVNVAWIQPGTPPALQKYKNDDQFAAAALNSVFNLSAEAVYRSGGAVDLLLIPESSVPFLGTDGSDENQRRGVYSTTFLAVVAYLARLGDLDVLYNELSFQDGKLKNLATAFTRVGARSGSYQKRHLVPFGEYLPGEDWVPSLRRMFPEASNYEPGASLRLVETGFVGDRGQRTLPPLTQSDLDVLSDARRVMAHWPAPTRRTEPLRIAPLICYEGLFPHLVRDLFVGSDHSPDLVVNLVNDSWFGDYLENYQHAMAARIRAVESGRTLVRAALSGVSGAYDPWGRRLGPQLAVGEAGYAIASVPIYSDDPTLYVQFGNAFVWIALGLIVISVVFLRRKPRRSSATGIANHDATKEEA